MPAYSLEELRDTTERHLLAIAEHALGEFPRECCGYILGTGGESELFTCQNVQDRLHAIDPVLHPRDSSSAYQIGGSEQLRFVRSFDSERPASVLYHSHPEVGAYFSEEDARAALAAGYPVVYLVVDAQADRIIEARMYQNRNGSFEEVARFPIDLRKEQR